MLEDRDFANSYEMMKRMTKESIHVRCTSSSSFLSVCDTISCPERFLARSLSWDENRKQSRMLRKYHFSLSCHLCRHFLTCCYSWDEGGNLLFCLPRLTEDGKIMSCHRRIVEETSLSLSCFFSLWFDLMLLLLGVNAVNLAMLSIMSVSLLWLDCCPLWFIVCVSLSLFARQASRTMKCTWESDSIWVRVSVFIVWLLPLIILFFFTFLYGCVDVPFSAFNDWLNWGSDQHIHSSERKQQWNRTSWWSTCSVSLSLRMYGSYESDCKEHTRSHSLEFLFSSSAIELHSLDKKTH